MIPNAGAATYPYQAEPDSADLDIITAVFANYGVVSGCACTAAASGATLGVAVASGSVCVGSKTAVAVTGTTVTPSAANGSNPRLDLVTADNTGTLAVVTGTADATPEFPAIPAGRTVLCAVAIPAAATSITNANIVDKRQMVDYSPEWGTTSTTTARGDHLHAGEYASTAHAATHLTSGSDPITGLTDYTATDGSANILWYAQNAADPALSDADGRLRLSVLWRSWRPIFSGLSMDRVGYFDFIAGEHQRWYVQPNTGTTIASCMLSLGAATTIGQTTGTSTVSHPAYSNVLGYRTRFATAASSAASGWAVYTTNAIYCRGDSTLPWCGYFFHARVGFPDASYANSGASTGTRFFCGLTDQTAANAFAADDPGTNNRHGFQYINVNGGKTQTNFQMTIKNTSANTESLTDTGIALTQNHVYDFFIFQRPNGGYPFGEVRDLTAGTTSTSIIDVSGQIPLNTVAMRAMLGLQSINIVARNCDVLRVGAEVCA